LTFGNASDSINDASFLSLRRVVGKARMLIYGQPSGPAGYDIIDSPIMLYWMPILRIQGNVVQHPFQQGYKVHVSVDLGDAERVAIAVLPVLQQLQMSHKVVFPLSAYEGMNRGDQGGKFMTIYPGPVLESFTRLINRLDPELVALNARPGPTPRDRQAGHTREEQRIGLSRMLSYVVSTNYRR
jgi:hypothetical protein